MSAPPHDGTDAPPGGSWILAVDFGTSYSSAVVVDVSGLAYVELGGERRVPSGVLLAEDGSVVVGASAAHQAGVFPNRYERTPKRYIGRRVMVLGESSVTVADAVGAVLSAFVDEARRLRGGSDPAVVVLSYPARWGDDRISALREAAATAGVPDPVLVAEPVAAATHYLDGLTNPGRKVAVYDLGGGTFDTAVLLVSDDGSLRVAGEPGGNPSIGGEVFDHRLFELVGQRIADRRPDAWEHLTTSDDRRWRRAASDLQTQLRVAKEILSTQTRATVYVPEVDLDVTVTRDELEGLIRDDIERTVDELEATVERAGLQIGDLDAVYLAGGSSRIPLVTQMVTERFGDRVTTWDDPKMVVAMGAGRSLDVTTVPLPQTSTLPTPDAEPTPDPEAVPDPASPPVASQPQPSPPPPPTSVEPPGASAIPRGRHRRLVGLVAIAVVVVVVLMVGAGAVVLVMRSGDSGAGTETASDTDPAGDTGSADEIAGADTAVDLTFTEVDREKRPYGQLTSDVFYLYSITDDGLVRVLDGVDGAVQGEFEVSEGVRDAAPDRSWIWVASGDGTNPSALTQITAGDPPEGSFPLGGDEAVDALAVDRDDRDVWVAREGGTLLRVDSFDDEVATMADFDGRATSIAIVEEIGWLATDAGLVRFDAADDDAASLEVVDPDLEASKLVGTEDDRLWATTAGDVPELVEIDPRTGDVLQRVELPEGPVELASLRDVVWVVTDASVLVFDGENLELTARATLDFDVEGIAVLEFDGTWISGRDGDEGVLIHVDES